MIPEIHSAFMLHTDSTSYMFIKAPQIKKSLYNKIIKIYETFWLVSRKYRREAC